MKKVISSSSKLIHLFAEQSQEEANVSGGSIYFEKSYGKDIDYGDKIYSYGNHYLLGEFLNDRTIMINDSGYSNTTSKHISWLTSATSQYKQFFVSETSLYSVHNDIKTALRSLINARKPHLYTDKISYLWGKLNEFAEWDRQENNIYKKNYETYNNPKYKEIKKIVGKLSEEGSSKDYLEILSKARKSSEAAEKKRAKKVLKLNLEDFKNYEIRRFKDWLNNEDYLRISQNGERVESSQDVSIKAHNALRLYKLILAGKNIDGRNIEQYTITSMNGTLKVGCHNINMESVHKVGKELLKREVQ